MGMELKQTLEYIGITIIVLSAGVSLLVLVWPSLKTKIRIFFDSWYATRFGKRQKKIRQSILAKIDRSGPVTEEELNKITRFSSEEISMKLSDLIWCRWAEKSISLEKDSVIHYVITDKGKRQLANPGSTDHEPI